MHNAGDKSTDMSWYSKRATLAAVYTATELFMLTDVSPDFEDTWAFLDRRLSDAAEAGKLLHESAQVAGTFWASITARLQQDAEQLRGGP
jgi:ubiquinone biosynthesis protein COQ9